MDEAQPLATDVACIRQSAPGLHDQQQQVQLVTPTSTASTSVRTPPSASSNASPAKGNPKLLQLLGDSVELMSNVLNGEHMDCEDTQAQLQAQLHNIKQQLQGTEMQMDRPRSDSTDDTWQVQDTNDRDVAAGASTDQEPAPCAVSLPSKEKPFTCTSDDGCQVAQPAVVLEPRDDAVSSASIHPTCSKSGTPTAASTSSTASGLPPRPPAPPAVAAAAQEQAAALATALSAVAAAAASQQLPIDTASNLAAALVRSASRARLCDEEPATTPAEPPVAPVNDAVTSSADAAAAAHDVFASDPSLDEPSVFAQPAAALLEILSEDRPVAAHELLLMAAVATEQLDPPAIAALKSVTSTTSLPPAANRAERAPAACEPSQQALADALHAITVEKLTSAVSVPSTTPTAPPETSSTDSAGLHAAVRAALVNLPPGGAASTAKASKSSHSSSTSDATARNGIPQRQSSATSTATPASSDSANAGADRSQFSHTLAKMLQQHMAHPEQTAAPVTVDAGAVVPLPALQPIKVAQLRATEGSSSSSQPGTPGDSQAGADVAVSALTALQCPGSLPRSGSNGSAGSSSSSSTGGSVGDDAARIYSEDVALARLLLAAVEKSGQSGLMLAKLLHFTAADETDISNALSDSSMSPLQLLASYLHNIRIVSADAEAAAVDGCVSSCPGPSAPAQRELAERLLTNLVDTFCSMLPVDAASVSPADTLQATVSAAQQQQQVTVVPQPAAAAVPAACATAASSTDASAQVAALLSMLQAAAQPAPTPVAAPPAAVPLPAANNIATLLSSLLTQQSVTQPVVTASQPNALAALLQQLSSAQGNPSSAAVVPTAPAALPVAAPVAGNDMASVLAAAMQVIAAQQQQEQQRAAMQAAMQTLVQQQHQQQQQQLAQQQFAQQHAAAAAAVAAAGLSTAQNTGLDLQSLQLLASLQQQQQQQQQHQAVVAEVLAQTHTNPANNQLIMQASVGLPPIAPSAATATGAHSTAAAAAAAAAAARVDSQYSLQNVHSLSALMPPSSGVAPAAASVSSNTPASTVAGYNLQRQVSFTGSGANTAAPSLPSSLLQQQQQQRAQPYCDSTGAAPWAMQGSDPAGLLSVSSLSTASANKAGSVASLASLNSQASTVNSAATGHQPASASAAGSTAPVGTAAAVAAQPAPSSTPVEGQLAAAGQPNPTVSIPAVAAALAAAQHHPGTPPSPGPLTLYDGTTGFSGHGEAALAQQNAAALAQMQSLEAAAAASQQQQVQAAQQHHAAAAAAAAAVVAAQQQVQAQQQQMMMNELLYGYQSNAAAAAAVGSVQGMMGLPATSAPLGVHYGSFSAESVEWQLWQQQQQAQHATQQP